MVIIGYAPLDSQTILEPYKEENDVIFYTGEKSFSKVTAGMFAVLFPADVHMPGINFGKPSKVKKVVIKVRIN
jgi:YhcH/YjgK/YiaL family protein